MLISKSLSIVAAVAVATLVLTSAPQAGRLESAKTFDAARELAAEHDVPVLIKVGASWCSACKAFDEATMSDAELKKSIHGKAVLFATDGEKGEGVDIARAYAVSSFPTFVLTNAKGEMLDRWSGYWGPEYFVKAMTKAVDNPITVADRLERFRDMPNEADARKLGELRLSEGLFAEAVAYYQRAGALNPDSEENYDAYVMKAMSYGTADQLFTLDQLGKQADRVLAADGRSDMDVINVALTMQKSSAKLGEREVALPYLKTAIEQTDDAAGEKVAKMRARLMPDYVLHIQKDEAGAVTAMKSSMGEGWTQKAEKLNHFAWWCYENRVNLDEAESLARKGVELAEAGTPKANILDTVAEICNVKGDCADSVELIQLAIAEDPENPYFRSQLERFETLLAAAND